MARPRIGDQLLPLRTIRMADDHWEKLRRLDRDGSGRTAVLRRLLDAIDTNSGNGVIVLADGGNLRITVDQRTAAAG